MIHMMQLNGSILSILLNTFHITSQGYSLAEACEISVQRKLLHTSSFLPQASASFLLSHLLQSRFVSIFAALMDRVLCHAVNKVID